MREKQLRALQQQHNRYVNTGYKKQPSIQPHINIALVSGEPVKMRTQAEIVALSRKKIAEGTYNRNLEFHDVFSSCNGYEADMKQWQAAEKKRQALVARYRKVADPLMRKAELADDADPEDIAAKLAEAAESAGLVAMPAGEDE